MCWLRVNTDSPSHPFDSLPYNSQTYTGAGIRVSMKSLKHSEQLDSIVGCDTNTIVLDKKTS